MASYLVISQPSLLQILSRDLANILSAVNIGKVIPVCQIDLFEALICSELRILNKFITDTFLQYGMSSRLSVHETVLDFFNFPKLYLLQAPQILKFRTAVQKLKAGGINVCIMGGYVNTLCLLSTPINSALWKLDLKKVFRVNLKMYKFL